ncbi:unnamed protein product [Adineta ricciae]|uniref:G-protein coupled receptors family 1 profile domain-containing protein n=1 Tax=Adineta ricciae TaxID=249248 RepID=A0A814VJU5_ADIRI|nr:unnamed protein product [Adineta ricciae]CAF1191725.1 unnamed protein product [Adineta ricciae]
MISTVFITGFGINAQNSSALLCKLYIYVGFTFSTLFPTILILASIDRLLISSQDTSTRLYSSRRLAYFSISFNASFWSIFFVHVLIKGNIIRLYPGFYLCYFDANYLNFVSYSSLVINAAVCLAMIVLSMFAFKNVRHIRVIPTQQLRKQLRTMNKKDFQLLRCLFVHDLVYISFSIFINVYYVYDAATKSQTRTSLRSTIESFVENFLLFLHHVPFCCSFVIFIIVSKAFRNEVKRMVYKILGKTIVIVREDENRAEVFEKGCVERQIVSLT